MSKKAKAAIVAGLTLIAAIGDIFLSTWLHLTLKRQFTGGADLRISNCLSSLMSDRGHRLMYLMILLVMVCGSAALFLMEKGKEDYSSDTVRITDKISTPVAVGQGQHGSAKWLDEKDYDHIFDPVIIRPGNRTADMLIKSGYDDLKDGDNDKNTTSEAATTGTVSEAAIAGAAGEAANAKPPG